MDDPNKVKPETAKTLETTGKGRTRSGLPLRIASSARESRSLQEKRIMRVPGLEARGPLGAPPVSGIHSTFHSIR